MVLRSQLVTLGSAKLGRPFVRITASREIRTDDLGVAKLALPFFAGGDEDEVPCTDYPRGSGPPPDGYAPVQQMLKSDGGAGYAYVSRAEATVDPVIGPSGLAGDFSIRFWLKRPPTLVQTSGTVFEYKSGAASLRLSVVSSIQLALVFTDGTNTASGTSSVSLPTVRSSLTLPDGWTGITLVYNVSEEWLRLYVGDTLALDLDTAPLSFTSTAGSRRLALLSKADASAPLDAGIIGFATFGGEALSPDEIEALNAAGPTLDIGNPTGAWDGSKLPSTYYREAPKYVSSNPAFVAYDPDNPPVLPGKYVVGASAYVPNAAAADCGDDAGDLVLIPKGDTSDPVAAPPRIELEAHWTTHQDRRPVIEIGAEGGYFLEVFVDQEIFLEGYDFNVKFKSGDSLYPDTQPGAYSSVPGSPYVCARVRGGRGLRFTSPAMPHGSGSDEPYDVVITGPGVGTLVIPAAVYVMPMQISLEVMSMRALPGGVYRPWGSLGPYTGSNEGYGEVE